MNLLLLFALLLIASGIPLLLWRRHLFYAWLPVFYGLLGCEIGFLLGSRLFGKGSAPIIGGVLLGVVVASATYVLEPRRIVLGYLGGRVGAARLGPVIRRLPRCHRGGLRR